MLGNRRRELGELKGALAELDAAMAAHSCPHGRPVWIRISRARLEALFHRTG